jgi:hypothetical protein
MSSKTIYAYKNQKDFDLFNRSMANIFNIEYIAQKFNKQQYKFSSSVTNYPVARGELHHMKNEEISNKVIKTQLEKYGCLGYNQEWVKKQQEQTCLEKYGIALAVNDPSHMMRKYGVDNPRKMKMTCPHCNKTGQYVAMKRWHGDNCNKLRIIKID